MLTLTLFLTVIFNICWSSTIVTHWCFFELSSKPKHSPQFRMSTKSTTAWIYTSLLFYVLRYILSSIININNHPDCLLRYLPNSAPIPIFVSSLNLEEVVHLLSAVEMDYGLRDYSSVLSRLFLYREHFCWRRKHPGCLLPSLTVPALFVLHPIVFHLKRLRWDL